MTISWSFTFISDGTVKKIVSACVSMPRSGYSVVQSGSGAAVEYIHRTSTTSRALSRRQLKHLCKSNELQ